MATTTQRPVTRPADQSDPSAQDQLGTEGAWRAVVWNDPVNLMSYVVYVLRAHFGFPRSRAVRLMRQVHEQGRAIVARGSRERIESHVHALQGYGLQATVEQVSEGEGPSSGPEGGSA